MTRKMTVPLEMMHSCGTLQKANHAHNTHCTLPCMVNDLWKHAYQPSNGSAASSTATNLPHRVNRDGTIEIKRVGSYQWRRVHERFTEVQPCLC